VLSEEAYCGGRAPSEEAQCGATEGSLNTAVGHVKQKQVTTTVRNLPRSIDARRRLTIEEAAQRMHEVGKSELFTPDDAY
jgi:hypothetical protein